VKLQYFPPPRVQGVQWDSVAVDITDSQYTVQVYGTKHMPRYTHILVSRYSAVISALFVLELHSRTPAQRPPVLRTP